MAVKKKKRQPSSLSSTRPPTVQRAKSMSRKATKSLINKHHLLEKRRRQAVARGDAAEEAAVAAEIESWGGLEKYQQASLQGQREDRGGDSSRVLMKWLDPVVDLAKDRIGRRLCLLEVGALSTDNACSRADLFDIERIDLNSQAKGILQQDFMERPLPRDASEKFDIISLSLVLNFVPEPKGRGAMLLRTLEFLHEPGNCPSESYESLFPSLFLVLPAPCVSNSRYLNEEKLEAIMASLGYVKTASKTTQRLVYYLWRRISNKPSTHQAFPKEEIRGGPSRNNFAIVLKHSPG